MLQDCVRLGLTIMGLVAFIGSASAQTNAWIIGAGHASCGWWTLNPANDPEAETWILGFWSGINVGNPNHMVGKTTDAYGIIGEVKLECQAKPSEDLSTATAFVYSTMNFAGK